MTLFSINFPCLLFSYFSIYYILCSFTWAKPTFNMVVSFGGWCFFLLSPSFCWWMKNGCFITWALKFSVWFFCIFTLTFNWNVFATFGVQEVGGEVGNGDAGRRRGKMIYSSVLVRSDAVAYMKSIDNPSWLYVHCRWTGNFPVWSHSSCPHSVVPRPATAADVHVWNQNFYPVYRKCQRII